MSPGPAIELTTSTAYDYLAARGLPPVQVTELAGGVSNTVLLVETKSGRLVIKQSLPQLRVEQQWLSDRSRIWREASALEMIASHLPEQAVPAVLFRDDNNFLFGMSAAPEGSQSWKSLLMSGQFDPAIAEQIGTITAALVRCGRHSETMKAAFGDLTVFTQLRLDPYYRTVALRQPDLAGFFSGLVDRYPSEAYSLVHGDWSPKNFLAGSSTVTAIDFEAIHFGDPAFDSAFLLNHLLLKSFHMPGHAAALARLADTFWRTLIRQTESDPRLETRTIEHLGALLLSRIDGKSPAEYIREPDQKQRIREFARQIILAPPRNIQEVFERCA